MTQRKPRASRPIIDLFSGFGGFTVGLMQANYYPIKAVDIDQEMASLFNVNVKYVAAAVGAQKIKWPLMLNHLRRKPGMTALVVGDAPFNGHTYQHAYHFFRAVREVSPLGFAFLTDVDFLTQDDPKIWNWRYKQRRILDDYRWGYQVVDYSTIGIPIKKKRALVFGVHQDCNIQGFEDKASSLYMEFPEVPLPDPIDLFEGLPVPYKGNTRSLKVSGQSSKWELKKWVSQQPYVDSPSKAHHPQQKRRITLREMLRLYGYPDSVRLFDDTPRKAVWNTTPPILAQMIGAWFLRVDWIYWWSEARLQERGVQPHGINYEQKSRTDRRRRYTRILHAQHGRAKSGHTNR